MPTLKPKADTYLGILVLFTEISALAWAWTHGQIAESWGWTAIILGLITYLSAIIVATRR